MERAKTRDSEKTAAIIAQHGPRITQLAAWYLDGRDVDDVLQEIWASVYRRLRREVPLPPESWSALESFVSDEGSPLDEILETRELRQVLSAELDRLPGAYGLLLRLRYMKDLGYQEISDATETSVNLIKQRLHQGREILRSRLAKSLREIRRRHHQVQIQKEE